MLDAAVHLEDELGVGAIRPTQQPHALDLLTGEGGQIPRADEPYPPNATAVGEGEALALLVQLPPGLLVLHRAAVALVAGIALLSGSLLAAVGVEPLNGGPGASGGRLTGLGVEVGGERILLGQAGAEGLQVVRADTPPVHPQAHALIADELGDGIASSIAACWARERRSLYSKLSILPLLSWTTELAQT